MKFKSFYIRVTSEAMHKACYEHGLSLGYRQYDDKHFSGALSFYRDGDFQATPQVCIDPSTQITLDEFFALTPEDVIVEPKRFNVCFSYNTPSDYSTVRDMLTQDQIDRIKAIMGES